MVAFGEQPAKADKSSSAFFNRDTSLPPFVLSLSKDARATYRSSLDLLAMPSEHRRR
jgi:hypothetical protein